jgi:hypothetical protein
MGRLCTRIVHCDLNFSPPVRGVFIAQTPGKSMDFSSLATVARWLNHARTLVMSLAAIFLRPAPENQRTHVRLSLGHGWLEWERDAIVGKSRLSLRRSSLPAKTTKLDRGFGLSNRPDFE